METQLNLSIIHPDELSVNEDADIELPIPPPPSRKSIDLGSGNFDWIVDSADDKLMLENAWLALTETDMWDFVAEEIDSFMWSDDPRIYVITNKMSELGYDGHSGSSFGLTMRNMQYLARHGIHKFKKMYLNKSD